LLLLLFNLSTVFSIKKSLFIYKPNSSWEGLGVRFSYSIIKSTVTFNIFHISETCLVSKPKPNTSTCSFVFLFYSSISIIDLKTHESSRPLQFLTSTRDKKKSKIYYRFLTVKIITIHCFPLILAKEIFHVESFLNCLANSF
jgi:hypothetical protein